MKSFCKIVVCCLLAGTAGTSFGMKETSVPKTVCGVMALSKVPGFALPDNDQNKPKKPAEYHWPSFDDNYRKEELEPSKPKQ